MEVLIPTPVNIGRQTAMAVYGPALYSDPSRFDAQIPTPPQKITYKKTTTVNTDVQGLRTELANVKNDVAVLKKTTDVKISVEPKWVSDLKANPAPYIIAVGLGVVAVSLIMKK